MTEEKTKLDEVYEERNRCVAGMAAMALRLGWSAWLGKHDPVDDPTWDREWFNVVFIALPSGQVSWHIHDRDLVLFHFLPFLEDAKWDGHTTEQKYDRVDLLGAELGFSR